MRQSARTWLAVAGLVALQLQFFGPVSQQAGLQATPAQSSADAAYAHLPLAFEPNQGQADSSVDFLVHHGQAVTAFAGTNTTTSVGGKQVTMSLNGANSASFTGQDELQSKTNYFLGNDQSQWHSDIPNFQKLLAKNVYAGIDLAYYGTNSTLEHDFIVNPGSDYHQIAFNFTGQDTLLQDKDGNLILKAGDEQLQLNAPTTYQLGEHEKHTIPSKFELTGDTVTVAVASDYDHTKPLVIDPVLMYSTYLGGTADDLGTGIAIDGSGNAYLVGYTTSTNFPTASPYQASSAGGAHDVFVSKLNPAGSSLVYSTYLGGNGDDLALAIVADASGAAYVAGYTSSTNFPTASPIQASHIGSFSDGFVTKLTSNGSSLVFSTYYGGTNADFFRGIALDSLGNVIVVGNAQSTDYPMVAAFQGTKAGGASDVLVTKFNAAGSAVLFSTYLGGTGDERSFGVAIDSSDNIYLTGFTASTNFPTSSPYQAANAGGAHDAFIAKFAANGASLGYSTYLGGSGDDTANSIGLDANNNAFVSGTTASTNFPTSSPYQASKSGTTDVFATKLNTAGSALSYSTYIGGSGDETSFAIATDPAGAAVIAGHTTSTNFPTVAAYQSSFGGGPEDVFAIKLNVAGSSPVYSTYLGGSGDDVESTVKIGLNGDAYIIGLTNSTNFPTQAPYQATSGGGFDTFITQLNDHSVTLSARVDPTLTFTVGSTSCALGSLSTTQTQFCTYNLTAATNGTSGYSISYLPVSTLTSGANTITALTSPTASALNTEQFGINLAANTAVGSHTASNFGAAPSGGSGTASANYTTANSFKLATGGETIATATSPSLTTTYTVSTIANITNTTEAGAYTTTFTYNIVSTY